MRSREFGTPRCVLERCRQIRKRQAEATGETGRGSGGGGGGREREGEGRGAGERLGVGAGEVWVQCYMGASDPARSRTAL